MTEKGRFWTDIRNDNMHWLEVKRIMVATNLILYKGRTVGEIAEMLGLREEKVREYLTRGLKKLSRKKAMIVENILKETDQI